MSTKQILEREISHRLCLGPMSRSTLMKNLPFREADEDDDNPFESMIDEILKEVAVYREPNLTGKGKNCTIFTRTRFISCLLYTSDAADE